MSTTNQDNELPSFESISKEKNNNSNSNAPMMILGVEANKSNQPFFNPAMSLGMPMMPPTSPMMTTGMMPPTSPMMASGMMSSAMTTTAPTMTTTAPTMTTTAPAMTTMTPGMTTMAPGMTTMAPGMMTPGMMTPGMMAPGMIAPGMMTPGMMTPGMMTPGMMTPGMMTPGMMTPGMMTPGMMTPGMMAPGMMAPGMTMMGAPMMNQRVYSADQKINSIVNIWKGDITTLQMDAIVNSTNNNLIPDNIGILNKTIHSKAGPNMAEDCRKIGPQSEGNAVITKGYNLPAKFVIHTVCPKTFNVYLLKLCYTRCLELLVYNNLRSIAFSCISTGSLGFSNNEACKVALESVREWLEYGNNKTKVDKVVFCVYSTNDESAYNQNFNTYFPK